MNAPDRHLQAAEGYLELGMAEQAQAELDTLPTGYQADLRVIALRMYACQELERWDAMATMAAILCEQRPDDPQWPISLAYATRRARSLIEAREVLLEASTRFPEEAMIQFNLACYECQLGRLPEARRHLREASRLNKACRKLALEDSDLIALHEELRAGTL